MDDSYTTMIESRRHSSKTKVDGSGIIDSKAWTDFHDDVFPGIQKLPIKKKREMLNMYNNVKVAWVKYCSTSLKNKKHDDETYQEFLKIKDTVSEMLTWAVLGG